MNEIKSNIIHNCHPDPAEPEKDLIKNLGPSNTDSWS